MEQNSYHLHYHLSDMEILAALKVNHEMFQFLF